MIISKQTDIITMSFLQNKTAILFWISMKKKRKLNRPLSLFLLLTENIYLHQLEKLQRRNPLFWDSKTTILKSSFRQSKLMMKIQRLILNIREENFNSWDKDMYQIMISLEIILDSQVEKKKGLRCTLIIQAAI